VDPQSVADLRTSPTSSCQLRRKELANWWGMIIEGHVVKVKKFPMRRVMHEGCFGDPKHRQSCKQTNPL